MAKRTVSNEKTIAIDIFPDIEVVDRFVSNSNAFGQTWSGMYNMQQVPGTQELVPRIAFDLDPGTGSSTSRHTCLGGYYWAATGKWYSVEYNGSIYRIMVAATSASAPTALQTVATVTERRVGFVEYNYGTHYLVVATGAEVWYIATNDAVTKISDAQLPAPHVPTPVVFDGYLFLAASGTQNIYNSLPGDLTNWAATTYIAAERSPGDVKAIALRNNKLLAFKEDLIEEFRDAGRAAPNSPLARTDQFWEYNILNWTLMCQEGDHIWWVGDHGNGGDFNVLYLGEGEQITKISTPGIAQWIRGAAYGYMYAGLGTMYTLYDLARTLVVLTPSILNPVADDISSTIGTYSLVYDTANKKWMFWSTAKTNASNNQTAALPFVNSTRTFNTQAAAAAKLLPTIVFCRTYYAPGSTQPQGFTLSGLDAPYDAYLQYSLAYTRWDSGIIVRPFKDDFQPKFIHSLTMYGYNYTGSASTAAILLDIEEITKTNSTFGPAAFTPLSPTTGQQHYRWGPLGRMEDPAYVINWGQWSSSSANINHIRIRQLVLRYTPSSISV